MDESKLNQIKAYLAEEEEIGDRLKKNPNLGNELLSRLNRLYHNRVTLIRSEYGCGVNRDLWDILKNVLLEQANLEKIIEDGMPADKRENMQRILTVTKNKRDILVNEVEQTLDTSAACPLLPEGKSVSSISAHIREKSQSIVDKQQKGKGGEKEREHDIKRRDLIRLFMSPQFS